MQLEHLGCGKGHPTSLVYEALPCGHTAVHDQPLAGPGCHHSHPFRNAELTYPCHFLSLTWDAQINYVGWLEEHDEWIPKDSDRFDYEAGGSKR